MPSFVPPPSSPDDVKGLYATADLSPGDYILTSKTSSVPVSSDVCYAATTYNPERSQFSTYAKRIVCNGLFSYCRQMHSRQSYFTYFAVDKQGNLLANGEPYVLVDDFDIQINMIETLDLLAYAEKKYQGVTKLGIEALKLKLKGISVSEIASLYHVPPPHVGAWISRATQKLRKDTPFLSGLL